MSLFFFYTSDCSACQIVEPLLPKDVKKVNLDLEENFGLAVLYDIKTIPCIVEIDEEGSVAYKIDRPTKRDLSRYVE